MNKEDKKTILLFIALIIGILFVFLLNVYRNKSVEADRKKEANILGRYSYSIMEKDGIKLFFDAVKLLDPAHNLEFESVNDRINLYSFGEYEDYKKIINFNIISDVLSTDSIKYYINNYNIVENGLDYYYKGTSSIPNDYVGSIINIDSYNDKEVTFSNANYFCENSTFIGELSDEPDCNFIKNETIFRIILENDNLRIKDFQDIEDLLQ